MVERENEPENPPGVSGEAIGGEVTHPSRKLGELAATAICGNDITSSCLYVSALAILKAGSLAPLALLVVAVVLFLFRSIYAEVVGALPLNGGAYNALLNTTSKFRASVAACLTILSYVATAVISANEAVHYVHGMWGELPVLPATVGLLAVFCGLMILGISESSRVAIGIFCFHIATLVLLLVVGAIHVASNGVGVFLENLDRPPEGGVATALFFGFSAAMLGISGFESSANFVEEQAPGVFPRTLRNMWVAVSFFNPVIALLVLSVVPIPDVDANQEALLAHVGGISGGGWLSTLISIDAALVLSGAVLTSYVGVNGLIHRMTLDRCLPQFLLTTNRRGTTHRILVTFFLLAVSILFITKGELGALAGVYTISFLAVMALFGVGNVLLKVKRSRLPRPTIAPWPYVVVGIAAVLAGLVGNAVMNPEYLKVFLEYFVPVLLVVSVTLGRIALLKAGLFVARQIVLGVAKPMGALSRVIREKIDQINALAGRVLHARRRHRQPQPGDDLPAQERAHEPAQARDRRVAHGRGPGQGEEGDRGPRPRLPRDRHRVRRDEGRVRAGPHPPPLRGVEDPGQPDVHRIAEREPAAHARRARRRAPHHLSRAERQARSASSIHRSVARSSSAASPARSLWSAASLARSAP
ncbi:MAG: amino acid permease [Planctomycetota bacterium]